MFGSDVLVLMGLNSTKRSTTQFAVTGWMGVFVLKGGLSLTTKNSSLTH